MTKDDPVKRILTQEQAKRLSAIRRDAPSNVTPFLRSYGDTKCPPRMAIKAFCLDCMGLDRQEITGCTATACPLWHFRPYRKG